jgi:membrane-bound lytic murein transglycosylase D
MTESPKLNDPLLATVLIGVKAEGAVDRDYSFRTPFKIGRMEECEVCIKNEFVSRVHASVSVENGEWWLSDLNSSNGVWVGGSRVPRVPLREDTVVRLGVEGPELRFRIIKPVVIPRPAADPKKLKSDYAQHYFGKGDQVRAAGEHTMLIRTVFAEVQKKQKRKYGGVIAALAGLMVCLGGIAFYEHQEASKQRSMAKDMFYSMKNLDIEIANLQDAVKASNSQQGMEQVKRIEVQRGEMESSYDHYLAGLHVYNPKMSEQDRLVLRVARIFGECELEMPPDFVTEVDKYIKYWQGSGRLQKAIQRAQTNGYTTSISKQLLDEGLPPQFFYLALQESDFDPYISGPMTRKGIAKGMWQFIPETGVKYGLHLGPLVDEPRPDPLDDRHHADRETVAAVHYLKDLYGSDAQGSGLLVMACYNWGEDYVLPLVRSMPLNPKDRNFWLLLQNHRDKIPKETYDYVFYIVSAAVIGENPRLFGFNFDNPLLNVKAQAAPPAGSHQAARSFSMHMARFSAAGKLRDSSHDGVLRGDNRHKDLLTDWDFGIHWKHEGREFPKRIFAGAALALRLAGRANGAFASDRDDRRYANRERGYAQKDDQLGEAQVAWAQGVAGGADGADSPGVCGVGRAAADGATTGHAADSGGV